ncbi:MAG TPA: hypothetical protein DEG43_16560 [Acidimicrobiaceae bacterium]|nr:hypothetical protein [Acidimicrobiaceae bacterium]
MALKPAFATGSLDGGLRWQVLERDSSWALHSESLGMRLQMTIIGNQCSASIRWGVVEDRLIPAMVGLLSPVADPGRVAQQTSTMVETHLAAAGQTQAPELKVVAADGSERSQQ